MAFWGIEVKPGKPYIFQSEDERGRLHLSQATLGSGPSTKKSIVECKVGDKKPIYLCTLLPQKLETCALNLEFDEDEEVTFSINGPDSVHLSGFFYPDDEDQDIHEDCNGCDHEMEIGSEDEDDSFDYDSEDEDDDDYSEDDLGMYPPSPVPNSGVRIEEIEDDEKPTNENVASKRAKKKKTQSSVSVENENANKQIVPRNGTSAPTFESEDEDGFPIPATGNKSDNSKSEVKLEETKKESADQKSQSTSDKTDAAAGKNLKRKSVAASPDEKPASESTENKKQKKNKKKKTAQKSDGSPENGKQNPDGTDEAPVAEIRNDLKPSPEKKKEKKKKTQDKLQENAATPRSEEKVADKKGPVTKKQEKGEAKSLQVRTFPNGLVVEELAMGKPDGKKASPGKKVSVHYIGKLKKNGKIFDSNIGRAPFKFRLGIGQVIKGWDVGVNGMRVGDKRRLTIPPAMGYGAKGAGAAIPPNSWLVFDVELDDVN